jgi:uncharacterized membrane protein
MPYILRPIIARVVGIIVAALVTWLSTKFGITVSDDDKQKLADGIITLVTIFATTYVVTHQTVSVKTNPSDSASPRLAEHGQAEQARLKQ